MTSPYLLQSSIESDPDIFIPPVEETGCICPDDPAAGRDSVVIVRPRRGVFVDSYLEGYDSKTSMEQMREEIVRHGIDLQHSWKLSTNDSLYERLTRYGYPRNLRWRELPFVGPAEFSPFSNGRGWNFSFDCLAENNPSSSDRKRALHGWDNSYGRVVFRHVMERAKVLIMEHPAVEQRDLAEFANVAEWAPSATVLFCDGKSVRPMNVEETRSAAEAWKAHHRFMRAYQLNARILCGRALVQALRESSHPEAARLIREVLGTGIPHLWDPWTMTIMYHLARNGHQSRSTRLRPSCMASLRASERAGLCRISADGLTMEWGWRGTGKYPEWTAPWVTASDGSLDLKDGIPARLPGAHFRTEGRHFPVFYLELMGLIGADDGLYGLTDIGRRYLELLGPSLDDADLLVRWRKPDGRIGGPKDVPAMDRWLNLAFRSVKRRVSDLPSAALREERPEKPVSPEVQNDRENWKVYWESTQKVSADGMRPHVVGRILVLSAKTMAEDGFPSATVRAILEGRRTGMGVIRGGNGTAVLWSGILCSQDALSDNLDSLKVRAQEAVAAMPLEIATWHATSAFGTHELPVAV